MSAACPPRPVGDSTQCLAVFDLDGTLVRRDSFLPFVVGYARSRGKFGSLMSLPLWVGLYGAGLLADHRAKEKILVSVFRGEPVDVVSKYASRFCKDWIRPQLLPAVAEKLDWHLRSGHRVILLSASPNLYVDAVGRELRITEVLCTRIKKRSEVWEGTIEGSNCKGQEKLHRLTSHLGSENWPGVTYSYGDSKSDLPVLRWARHGFVVGREGRLSPVGTSAC